jgi:hypothetical protein
LLPSLKSLVARSTFGAIPNASMSYEIG